MLMTRWYYHASLIPPLGISGENMIHCTNWFTCRELMPYSALQGAPSVERTWGYRLLNILKKIVGLLLDCSAWFKLRDSNKNYPASIPLTAGTSLWTYPWGFLVGPPVSHEWETSVFRTVRLALPVSHTSSSTHFLKHPNNRGITDNTEVVTGLIQ